MKRPFELKTGAGRWTQKDDILKSLNKLDDSVRLGDWPSAAIWASRLAVLKGSDGDVPKLLHVITSEVIDAAITLWSHDDVHKGYSFAKAEAVGDVEP